MRTRVIRWPIVFLHVRCSIFVRCSIMILLINIVRCSIPHCICMCISDIAPYLCKTLTWPYQEIYTENKRAFSDVVYNLGCSFSVPGPSVSICYGKSGTRTGFSPNTSVLPCRCHSIIASCSFFHPIPRLQKLHNKYLH